MVTKANHVLIHLIGHVKRTPVPNEDYPSKEVQDAYLQFKAHLRKTWIYEGLSVDDEPSNFKKIRKLILELDGAGVNKTWLDADVKELFNDLVKALKKANKQPAMSQQGLIPLFRGVDKKGFSKVMVTPGGVYGKGVYFYTDPWDARSHATYPGGGVVTGFATRKDVEVHEGGVVVMRDASNFIPAGKLTLDETTLPKSQYLKLIELALKKANKAEPHKKIMVRQGQKVGFVIGIKPRNHAELTDVTLARIEVVVKKIQEGKPLTQEEREMQRKYGLGTTAMYKRAEKLARNPISRSLDKHPTSKRVNCAEATGIGGEAGEVEGDVKGMLGIITGVSDGQFIGGFIPPEIQFIRTVIFLKNQQLEGRRLDFTISSERLINGNDVHLFCGHSMFATTRVDIRKEYQFQPKRAQGVEEYPPTVTRKTAATKNVLVQDFIADAIKKGKKYDLVIIDPPYNADYDKDYGTHQYNEIKETNEFFAWLVDGCTKILEQDGILISKNWRNMRPANSRFVAGILGKFGGFRRVSIMEAWQHQPTSMLDFSWEVFDSDSGKQTQMIPWYIGRDGKWTKKEIKMMAKHVDLDSTKSGVIITDPLGPGEAKPVKIGNLVNMTVKDFLADEKKHDVIILDQCKGIGGDRPTTVILKDRLASGVDNAAKRAWQHKIYNHAVDVLKRKGFVFTKTYFDPVLQKKDLELLEQHVICYESFEKINMFVLYKKP